MGKEPVAVTYLYVSTRIMHGSATMKEKSKQASFQRERPVGLRTTRGAFAEQFWHAPAGLLPGEGKDEALLTGTPTCPSPTGDTSGCPLAQL